MNTNTDTIHGHPLSEDGITCVFFAQCPGNSDVDLYRSVYATALETVGDASRARRMAEAYFQGRLTAAMLAR